MFSICYICLRCDRKLYSLNDRLEFFFDEMCEYQGLSDCQFCSECAAKLLKFYQFRKTCKLAAKTLKNWKSQKAHMRKPINSLHLEMPSQKLSLCRMKNYKVYFFHESDIDLSAIPISQNHPHIASVNIPSNETNDTIDEEAKPFEIISPEEIKQENELYTDVDALSECNYEIKTEIVKDDELNSGDDVHSDSSDCSSDSDASMKELLKKLDLERNSTEAANVEIDVPKRKMIRLELPVSIDKLKEALTKKFELCGVVKDRYGTEIQLDVILNNINKISVKWRKYLYKVCKAKGPLTKMPIARLSEIYRRFSGYENLFDILYLSNEAQKRAEFEKRRDYPNRPGFEYRCELCFKCFRYQNQLPFHLSMSHDESLPIECDLCKMRFKSEKMLEKHDYELHTIIYRCRECEFVAFGRQAMTIHYNKHMGVKVSCKHCDRQFTSRSVYYTHMRCHSETITEVCELCACNFLDKRGLDIHKRWKHKGEEFVPSEHNRKCDACDVTFANDDVYRTHLRITHKVGLGQTKRGDIRRNMPSVLKCSYCEWEGHSGQERKKHYLTVHPDEYREESDKREYLCHDCGKTFKQVSGLRAHLSSHRAERRFPCPHCPKRFKRSALLRAHLGVHRPPTLPCDLCGKLFGARHNLNMHYEMHRNAKSHKCHICGKGFTADSNMRYHIKSVHFNIKRPRKPKTAQMDV